MVNNNVNNYLKINSSIIGRFRFIWGLVNGGWSIWRYIALTIIVAIGTIWCTYYSAASCSLWLAAVDGVGRYRRLWCRRYVWVTIAAPRWEYWRI